MAIAVCSKLWTMSFLPLFVYYILTLDISYGADIHRRAADPCSANIPGNDPVYPVDDSKFCQCCDPGFYKKDDCGVSGEKAVCMPCGTGHYSSTPNQAIRCSLCSLPPKCSRPNIEFTQNCTMTTNYDCKCKDGFYFKPRLGSNGDGDCIKHTTCAKGFYIDEKGTPESDIVCKPCEDTPKTYSEEYNKSCSRPRKQEGCDPSRSTDCPVVMTHPVDRHSEETSIWTWILVVFAVILIVIFTAAIVLYYLKRSDIFDIVKFTSNRLYRRKSSRGAETVSGVEDSRSFTDIRPSDEAVGFRETESSKRVYTEEDLVKERSHYAHMPVQKRSASDASHAATACKADDKARTRKHWSECISYLASNIHVKEWRPVIRSLFVKLDTYRDGECIIQEVEANHPHDVREQIYNAFVKWLQNIHPRDACLNLICNVLIEKKECELAQRLKVEFPGLVKGIYEHSLEGGTIEEEEQPDTLNPDTSSKYLDGEHDNTINSFISSEVVV